jgi:hypothetical protein
VPEYRFPAAARVVAIGDLHGDVEAARAALRLAGAIDASDAWIGGDLVVVQTGDQLDRGKDERALLDLLAALDAPARAAGGRLVVLNGNHEVMNVLGDFRYVAPEAVRAFDGLTPSSPHAAAVSGPFRGRAAALLPGGAVALALARRPLVAIVGDTVFVHGGLRRAHVALGLERLNREASEFLAGTRARPPAALTEEEGPLWTRLYGDAVVDELACAELAEVLRGLSARRLVVGHTIQAGGISSACGGAVYRIDVGMSAAYRSGRIEVLELGPLGPRVLRR